LIPLSSIRRSNRSKYASCSYCLGKVFKRKAIVPMAIADPLSPCGPGRREAGAGFPPAFPSGLQPLVDRGDALPTPDAHGHERVAPADAGELVERLDRQHAPRGADRVAQRYAAA